MIAGTTCDKLEQNETLSLESRYRCGMVEAATMNKPFLSAADRALVEIDFSLTSLAHLGPLLEDIPSTATSVTVLARYDVSSSQREKVRCAGCHAARHHRGFHVETDAGRALVGRDCGRTRFGLDWEREEHRFDLAVARQAALERMMDAYPLLDELLQHEAQVAEGAQRLDGFIEALRTQHGKLSQAIARAVRDHGGALQYPEQVRDPAAEEANARALVPWLIDDVENASGPSSRKTARKTLDRWINDYGVVERTEYRSVGILRGGRCLTATEGLARLLGASLGSAKDVAAQMKSASVEPKRFVEIMRAVGHAYERIIDMNSQLDDFVTQANRQVIAEWSRKTRIAGELPQTEPWKSSATPAVERLWEIIGRA